MELGEMGEEKERKMKKEKDELVDLERCDDDEKEEERKKKKRKKKFLGGIDKKWRRMGVVQIGRGISCYPMLNSELIP